MQTGKRYYIYNYSDDEYYESTSENGEVSWVKSIEDANSFNVGSTSSLKAARQTFSRLKDDWCVNLIEVDIKVLE